MVKYQKQMIFLSCQTNASMQDLLFQKNILWRIPTFLDPEMLLALLLKILLLSRCSIIITSVYFDLLRLAQAPLICARIRSLRGYQLYVKQVQQSSEITQGARRSQHIFFGIFRPIITDWSVCRLTYLVLQKTQDADVEPFQCLLLYFITLFFTQLKPCRRSRH